jgi:hypothetical protein
MQFKIIAILPLSKYVMGKHIAEQLVTLIRAGLGNRIGLLFSIVRFSYDSPLLRGRE